MEFKPLTQGVVCGLALAFSCDAFASERPNVEQIDHTLYLSDQPSDQRIVSVEQHRTHLHGAEPAVETSSPFQGFYLGGAVGYTYAWADFSLGGVQVIDGSDDAFTASIFLGYGHVWNRFYLGAELYGVISTVNNEDNTAIGPVFLSGQIERSYGAGLFIRPGVVAFEDSTLFYGLVGAGAAVLEADFNLVGFGNVDHTFPYPVLQFGGGVEHDLGDGWAVRGQFVYSLYWEVDDPLNIPLSQSYNLDTATISIGIVWRPGQARQW